MRKSIKRKKIKFDKTELRYNEYISVPEVSLIDEEGTMLGRYPTREALRIATEKGYDLVEVSPKAFPPVTKLMDYGEYKYKKEKLEQKKKAGQKKVDLKGIRLSLRISKHDLDLRKMKTQDFLEEGHKVRIELMLRGREREHKSLAVEIVRKFISELGDIIKVEQPIQVQGGTITSIILKK